MNAPVLPPISAARHHEEVGTYKDALACALAPNAFSDDAPGIVSEALKQIAADLFMLGAALGDDFAKGPIEPYMLHQMVSGIRGRAEALQNFAEHKLVVRWRYDDDNELEIAKRSGLKSAVQP